MAAGPRVRRTLVAGAAGIAVLMAPVASTAVPEGGPRYVAGASGAGDPYFPFAGNGGYDVQHYDLDITYTPPAPAPAPLSGQFEGVATIELRATQDLDRFNLDLRGMDVHRVMVNGRRATEVAPPPEGAEVEGQAYWHVQNDASSGSGSSPSSHARRSRPGGRSSWSSSTAVPPRVRRTSRASSTAG